MNRLGWCAGIDKAQLLHGAGYDFIELALAPLKLENKEEHEKLMEPILNSPIPVKAFNVFFPKEIRIVGPEADSERIRRYVAAAAQTCASVGADIIVLGSGGARNVPEGWERERAEEQLLHVLSWCADELQGTGTTLAIEPLNRKESNILNSVGEAALLASKVNRPEIQVLADFYHMDEDGDPLQALVEYKDRIVHIHLADTGRLHPGSGSYDYATFSALLKETGYSGMISAECKTEQMEKEVADSLAFMRRTFA